MTDAYAAFGLVTCADSDLKRPPIFQTQRAHLIDGISRALCGSGSRSDASLATRVRENRDQHMFRLRQFVTLMGTHWRFSYESRNLTRLFGNSCLSCKPAVSAFTNTRSLRRAAATL